MKEEEKIVEYIQRVDETINTIIGIKEEVKFEVIIKKVLRSLNPKYDTEVSAIEEAKDLTTFSMDELFGSISSYDMRTISGELSKREATINIYKKGIEEVAHEKKDDSDVVVDNFVKKSKRDQASTKKTAIPAQAEQPETKKTTEDKGTNTEQSESEKPTVEEALVQTEKSKEEVQTQIEEPVEIVSKVEAIDGNKEQIVKVIGQASVERKPIAEASTSTETKSDSDIHKALKKGEFSKVIRKSQFDGEKEEPKKKKATSNPILARNPKKGKKTKSDLDEVIESETKSDLDIHKALKKGEFSKVIRKSQSNGEKEESKKKKATSNLILAGKPKKGMKTKSDLDEVIESGKMKYSKIEYHIIPLLLRT
ncbi:uncharacterized protein LOC131876675 [Cryptomeria japonica]|uniref:uncharacterized protein LOC131876675 n=1 Tax=Cryptomeria japonica TaxID=3369 RepID=UPI0027DA005E|nr:uncharacterized protein LOC131876675 [Cryptomeria japonica]